jgi:hypothetical protein
MCPPDENEELNEEDSEWLAEVSASTPDNIVRGGVIKKGVGRPKGKLPTRPSITDEQYQQELARQLQKFVEEDALVKTCEEGSDAINSLKLIKLAMTREAAALEFQRIEGQKKGQDVSQTCRHRVNTLRHIAAIEIDIKHLTGEVMNLRSEKQQRLFRLFVTTVCSTAQGMMPAEMYDLFTNKLSTALEGWEEKAEAEILSLK